MSRALEEGEASGDAESVQSLNRVFDVMDEANDILEELLEGWKAPRLVVIGNQCDGMFATFVSRVG